MRACVRVCLCGGMRMALPSLALSLSLSPISLQSLPPPPPSLCLSYSPPPSFQKRKHLLYHFDYLNCEVVKVTELPTRRSSDLCAIEVWDHITLCHSHDGDIEDTLTVPQASVDKSDSARETCGNSDISHQIYKHRTVTVKTVKTRIAPKIYKQLKK